MRTRAYRRHKNIRKALRKQFIDKHCCRYSDTPYYDNLHQYSKNKIHCSCFRCSTNTRNKGKRRAIPGNYSPSLNLSARDQRQADKMSFVDDAALVFNG